MRVIELEETEEVTHSTHKEKIIAELLLISSAILLGVLTATSGYYVLLLTHSYLNAVITMCIFSLIVWTALNSNIVIVALILSYMMGGVFFVWIGILTAALSSFYWLGYIFIAIGFLSFGNAVRKWASIRQ